MGRPPKQADEKRQLLSVRFDPEVRRAFEVAAHNSGRSLSKEIEYRASALAYADSETVELFKMLVDGIVALEARNSRKRWSNNLRSWAAAAELLAIGPIRDMRPRHDADEEAWALAAGPIAVIYDEKLEIAIELRSLGVPVSQDPLAGKGPGGLASLDSRMLERAAIDAIPDEATKEHATARHERMVELDRLHDEARADYREAMKPYWDEEAAGRELCHDYLRDAAAEKKARGEPYNVAHLYGEF